jgi:predicted AAA+ superfamily ATPase
MIARTLEKKLKSLAKAFPVVTVTGPRQSGKTTLVRHAFPDFAYVSLEDADTREFAVSDPRGFLASHNRGLVIDEAQRSPELFSYIQGVVDASGRPGRFILSGSQNFLLHEKISQSLAGRTAILRLLPLAMEEILKPGDRHDGYAPLMHKGFYPRLYASKIRPQDWYPAYIQTYVERDVRLLKNITDLDLFQKFVRLCAGRIGQLLNLSALGADAGINHNTARAWISLLEASYIVFLLRPHHQNFRKRLVKSPKLYFFDTGLASYLLGIRSASDIVNHHMRGPLFESMIITELLKYRYHRGLEPDGFFWRDKIGHEIDYVIDEGGQLTGIEIKSGRTLGSDFFAGLEYWQSISGQTADRSFLIYGGAKEESRTVGRVLPWSQTTDVYPAIKRD